MVDRQNSKKHVLEQLLAGASPPEDRLLSKRSKILIPPSNEVKVPIADSSRITHKGN